MLEVLIVGPGRLGSSVALILQRRGHSARLVGRGAPLPAASLTWLCVPDRAIALAAQAVPPGGVLLHASGATDLTPLRPHRPAGSLHPLMSFPGPGVAPLPAEPVPAAISGDPEALAAARQLALALGWSPFEFAGDRRLYHAAAVMAGNFTTALLAEAARVLSAAGVPADQAPGLLAPLAAQSIRNAAAVGPAQALTGPIARGDEAVIQSHRDALRGLPGITRDTYETLLLSTRDLADHAPD